MVDATTVAVGGAAGAGDPAEAGGAVGTGGAAGASGAGAGGGAAGIGGAGGAAAAGGAGGAAGAGGGVGMGGAGGAAGASGTVGAGGSSGAGGTIEGGGAGCAAGAGAVGAAPGATFAGGTPVGAAPTDGAAALAAGSVVGSASAGVRRAGTFAPTLDGPGDAAALAGGAITPSCRSSAITAAADSASGSRHRGDDHRQRNGQRRTRGDEGAAPRNRRSFRNGWHRDDPGQRGVVGAGRADVVVPQPPVVRHLHGLAERGRVHHASRADVHADVVDEAGGAVVAARPAGR